MIPLNTYDVQTGHNSMKSLYVLLSITLDTSKVTHIGTLTLAKTKVQNIK